MAYGASAIGRGRLIYAHLGRIRDLADLQEAGLNLTGSVAVIRLARGSSAADAVRNAHYFGASAAVLFPDPLDYAGLVSDDEALARSVKTRLGDPDSPYFAAGGSDAVPNIPVISISPRLAFRLVSRYAVQSPFKISAFWFFKRTLFPGTSKPRTFPTL